CVLIWVLLYVLICALIWVLLYVLICALIWVLYVLACALLCALLLNGTQVYRMHADLSFCGAGSALRGACYACAPRLPGARFVSDPRRSPASRSRGPSEARVRRAALQHGGLREMARRCRAERA